MVQVPLGMANARIKGLDRDLQLNATYNIICLVCPLATLCINIHIAAMLPIQYIL